MSVSVCCAYACARMPTDLLLCIDACELVGIVTSFLLDLLDQPLIEAKNNFSGLHIHNSRHNSTAIVPTAQHELNCTLLKAKEQD
jgi:hypothetical protein